MRTAAALIMALTIVALPTSMVNAQGSGFAIDKTGIVNPNTGKLDPNYRPHQGYFIDDTGIVSENTDFGKRLNYSYGYFRGVVKNGKRKSGTVFYKNGGKDTCTDFDEKGRFNGLGLMQRSNGWYNGYWTHCVRNGKGSLAKKTRSGRYIYYDQTWRNGRLISSHRVSNPTYHKDKYWKYTPPMPASSGSSSTTRSSRSRSSHSCPYCHNGYYEIPSAGSYGISTNKARCPNCGKLYITSNKHFCRCRHCGGTGRL